MEKVIEAQVWKYDISFPTTVLWMPKGSDILSVGLQERDGRQQIVLWALVVPANEKEPRTIQLIMTGEPHDLYAAFFIGTVTMGGLVFHIFDYGVGDLS